MCGFGCALIGVVSRVHLPLVLFVFSPQFHVIVLRALLLHSYTHQYFLVSCVVVFTCVTAVLCVLSVILPSLPHPFPSTAIIASSTSLSCTSSLISVSTTRASESCGGGYAVYTVSVHVLVASVSVWIYKCNLLYLHPFTPFTATVASSPDPQSMSLPSTCISPVSVSTTPLGEFWSLCTHYL